MQPTRSSEALAESAESVIALAESNFEEDVRKFMSEMRGNFKDLDEKVTNMQLGFKCYNPS